VRITIVATRPETVEFVTPEVTGAEHLRNHLAYFASDAPVAEKLSVISSISSHIAKFWEAYSQTEEKPTATPSPEKEEEA
jgi:hypothetical protein